MTLSSEIGERLSRALRSLDGLSVGDAFGERFFGPEARNLLTSRKLPNAPWRWTDDTAMAIGLVDVLSKRGVADSDELARVFAENWYREPARGYGSGTQGVLGEIHSGVSWREAAPAAFDGSASMGNGAAMRAPPLGAWFADDLDAVVSEAEASAVPTHSNEDGMAGAIAAALAAAFAARRRTAPREYLPAELLLFVASRMKPGAVRHGIQTAAAIDLTKDVRIAAAALGTGARVLAQDTVPFALWCAARHLDDFPAAMWTTVSGFGDRDTTCAIAGGIVALSAPEIPGEWLNAREPLPRP